MKVLYLALAILILLAACAAPSGGVPDEAAKSGQDTPETSEPSAGIVEPEPATPEINTEEPKEGYLFQAYGQDIYVCEAAAPILEALPDPLDTFESPSCAFEGVDITYFFPGFELTTYPQNGEEYVLSVALTDDSVTTPEGVFIGGTQDDIIGAYGSSYVKEGDRYSYTEGKGDLLFSLEDGVIIGILYLYQPDEAA